MEIIFEIVLPIVLEVLTSSLPDFVIACFQHMFNRPPMRNPVMAALGYGILGLIIGGISLLIFPNSFVKSADIRTFTLILSPIVAGLMMLSLRAYRIKHGKNATRIESFFYGSLLALGVSAVRYVFANH